MQVYPHKFIMDEQSIAWGRMRAGPADRKVCIDHLQKDMVSINVFIVIVFFFFIDYLQTNMVSGNKSRFIILNDHP